MCRWRNILRDSWGEDNALCQYFTVVDLVQILDIQQYSSLSHVDSM